MRTFFACTLFVMALAGRAIALNIVFGGALGNLTASQIIPTSQVTAACQGSCNPATQAILVCGDTNDACLCSTATVSSIVACEQCMFSDLIARNAPIPDPRVGSTPLLAAYSAACLASQNITIPAASITLAVPANWNGPFAIVMSVPVAIVTAIVGGMLGLAALLILSNL